MSHLLHLILSAHHHFSCYLHASSPISSLSYSIFKKGYISSSKPIFVIISGGDTGNLGLRFISIHVLFIFRFTVDSFLGFLRTWLTGVLALVN